jgi:N4-(beta-N-acetylglucosaminyl)-L-asparaginase
MPSRRDFLTTAALTSLALTLDAQETKVKDGKAAETRTPAVPGKRPILICAHNGINYLDEGFAILSSGGDTLEAALRVVRGPEDDPNDHSVGLGGLPNEDGVVELDSCCMHGPTRRGGAVGALRDIKNASLVARAVMEHTGHVMLVGEGAQRFGLAQGFPKENLLTDYSRKVWLLWKETHSNRDWWGPGLSDPKWKPPAPSPAPTSQGLRKRLEERAADLGIPPALRAQAAREVMSPPTGTIHCSALNQKGEMSGVTTTSGLAFKLSGRVGDSPIIGAGCYTDQDVGSAGATGSGEENIRVAGAHTIVENMRHGMSPHDAGMDALKRIVRNYNGDMSRLRYVDMVYYVLRNDGAYAGVSLWTGYDSDQGKPHYICVHDGTKRREPTTALLQGLSLEFPPRQRVA